MFGTVSQQKLSTFVHLDPLKERLNLPIVHHFLNVFNLKSYLRVYCLYVCGLVCIVCVCVCVCLYVWAVVSAGYSHTIPAHLPH